MLSFALKQNRYFTGSFASLPRQPAFSEVAIPIALSSAPDSGLACGSATCFVRTIYGPFSLTLKPYHRHKMAYPYAHQSTAAPLCELRPPNW